MAPRREALVPSDVPETVVNFRRVIPTADSNGDQSPAVLYRMAQLGNVSEQGASWMKGIGIKTIIDARALKEYQSDKKATSQHYSVFNVCFPFLRWRYHVGAKVKVKQVTPANQEQGRHILVNFLRFSLYAQFFRPAPWYSILFSLWILIKDIWNRNVYLMNFLTFYEKRWPTTLDRQYRNFIDGSQASIAAVFKLLAQPGALPAVIGCKWGKDRTGILVALFLSLMGETREYIAWEYALSQDYIDTIYERLHGEICQRYRLDESFICARKEVMLGALGYIDERYGGVEAYLEHCGFGKEEQATLKRNIAGKLKQT